MLLRMLYDDRLAQAAYLIGCQKTGEAILIDPERDVDRYLAAAAREGMRIIAVAETHIHADFLSGAREFAQQTGAKVYVSAEGGPEWQSRWLESKAGGGSYDHHRLRHGDVFSVGNIDFKALHTPGHTPEHMCYLVTDRGSGATEPMGVITGDFMFVGDVGRPDLLETAAGQRGTMESSARALYSSLRDAGAWPEFLQVWPGHGAGSACGKALGAVPQSTVGYERRFNPAIRAAVAEQPFIDFILSGQPEPPLYFARMKRQNADGPALLGSLPRPERLDAAALARRSPEMVAIDTRTWAAFMKGHLPGSIYAPSDSMFHQVVGSYVEERAPIVLIADEPKVEGIVRDLVRIGLDQVRAWAAPADVSALPPSALHTAKEIGISEARRRIDAGEVFVLDVRRADEFREGRLPRGVNVAYPRLPANIEQLPPKDRPILVNCRSGGRSSRACAYLQRLGYDATNLAGGFLAWEKEGGSVEGTK